MADEIYEGAIGIDLGMSLRDASGLLKKAEQIVANSV